MNKFTPKRFVKEQKHIINDRINYPSVRVIGIENTGIFSIKDALEISSSLEQDLILINTNANPPVCKIMDYKKFLFEEKQREKEQSKKQKENNKEMKEIRFTANTDDNDVKTKTKHIIDFIKNGHKVKAVVIFKGRDIQHKERGEILLLKIAEELIDKVKVEQLPKLEGKSMLMILAPKIKK